MIERKTCQFAGFVIQRHRNLVDLWLLRLKRKKQGTKTTKSSYDEGLLRETWSLSFLGLFFAISPATVLKTNEWNHED